MNPYENNPRFIDKHAAKKLRESLRKTGLVEPLVVNRREDGSLVVIGGHQRMRCMDEIVNYQEDGGSADYEVPVAMIQVSRTREAELVVSLNNPGMQGQYDADALAKLVLEPGISAETMGFERVDLSMILGAEVADKVFGLPPSAAAKQERLEAPIVDMLGTMKAAGAASAAASKAGGIGPATGPGSPAAAAVARAEEIQRMKEGRAAYRAKQEDNDATEFMLVVVFDSPKQMDRFLNFLDLPTTERHISGAMLADMIGADLSDESLDESFAGDVGDAGDTEPADDMDAEPAESADSADSEPADPESDHASATS